MKEKKLLWSLVMVVSLLLCGGGTGYAAVSGECSNCHTMHNSQGGVPMGLDEPQSALLLNDCLGCHTTDGTDPFVDGYPFVRLGSGSGDDNCLAGGFFPTTMGTGNNDDNHHGIGNTNEPAGFNNAETTWYTGHSQGGGNGLGCAGTNGCHGNETDLDDMAAIKGGHHDPSVYRILYVGTNGVVGYGAKDYEELIIKTPATTPVTTIGDTQNVNIYSAKVEDPSISALCAKCHGDFHNEIGSTEDTGEASPWRRHPTDVAIPTTWAIGDTGYTPDGDDYKHNPVGYDNAIFDITNKKATCLSCHRAHGTANNDLLRWAYTTQDAGSGTTEYGCLGCHDAQR
jgi:predicted CXXCH cytochrome family protein